MVKLNKIYTRTGDNGTSGLVDGSRIAKFDTLMHAIGDIDEANSALGVAIQTIENSNDKAEKLIEKLRIIQNDLFDLGADVATPANDDGFAPSEMVLRIITSRVDWLESFIDEVNVDLQPLNSFILPGGSPSSAALHMVRAIVRRAERSMAAAHDTHSLNPAALSYINRLSDLLFTLCRSLNNGGAGDILWVPGGAR